MRDGLQKAQIVHLVFGNLARVQKFGPAEKIALKIGKARLLAGSEFFAGFNFLSQHVATGAAEALDQIGLLGRRGTL